LQYGPLYLLGSARKGVIAQSLEIARDNDMLSYGESGYPPPAELCKEGDYEIKSSPFAPRAADKVVKKNFKDVI